MKATAKKRKSAKPRIRTEADSFESVAKRLECDPNLATFDAKLRKIAKAKKLPVTK